MSQVFDGYARYYDLLYRDKDYAAEALYISSRIRAHLPQAGRILELGCGTGAHAEHLAHEGYTVYGIDMSEEMLNRASRRKAALSSTMSSRLTFRIGDVRKVRLNEIFDAAISVFHVVSYQTENSDLKAMFATARKHLQPGGLFIFDAWYGPAVLTDRPTVRTKEFEDDDVKIIRIAQPTQHPNLNRVDVRYQIIAREKSTGRCEEAEEIHRMRYLFSPEVSFLAAEAGFKVIDSCEWMSGRIPDFSTWSVCFVCQA